MGGRWKRQNWIREQIRKGKGERTATGVVRDERGPEDQDNELKSAAGEGGRVGNL